MTDLQILEKCISDLGQVNIPAVLIETIGIPVYNVRQNLIALHNSIASKMNEAEENKNMPDNVIELPVEENQNENDNQQDSE